MSKKTVEELATWQEERLKNIKANPLVDYAKETKKSGSRRMQKTIADTSLDDDIRLELIGLSQKVKIYFKHEVGDINYCKVMSTAKNRTLISGLNANTQKLFLWIVYALKFRGDIVELDLEKMKTLGFQMSIGTFRNSILELQANSIIRRVGIRPKDEDYWMFFINPQILFKGDGKKFYNDVVKHHPDYLKPI